MIVKEWIKWIRGLSNQGMIDQHEALLGLDPVIIKEFEGLSTLIALFEDELTALNPGEP